MQESAFRSSWHQERKRSQNIHFEQKKTATFLNSSKHSDEGNTFFPVASIIELEFGKSSYQ